MQMKVLIFWFYVMSINATKLVKTMDLQKWEDFKIQFSKYYATPDEEELRMKIFKENMHKIVKHNKKFKKGKVSSKMKMNQFGDMTVEEFARIYLSSSTLHRHSKEMSRAHHGRSIMRSFSPDNSAAPEFKNWITDGAVTPPKNQGTCESGWAFAVVGAIESHYFIQTGKLVSLSEQNLLDCVGNVYLGNGSWVYHDCKSGSFFYPFKYVRDRGIDTEESYPYEGERARCNYGAENKRATIRDFKQLQPKDEEELKSIVGLIGPVTSFFVADSDFLQFHSTGIYSSTTCKNPQSENKLQPVLLVGYGTEGNEPYWLVKNSWGPDWGDGGFFRVRRGSNECGILSENYYPIV